MSVVLAAAAGVTLSGAALGLIARGLRAGVAATVGWVASGVAFVVATGLAVAVWQQPAPEAGAIPVVVADRITVSLVMLVCGVSAVVQAFAVRYLSGDARQRWFVVGAGVLTGSSVVLVSAATVLVLAAAWTVAGAALVSLLATYRDIPAARDGAWRAARAFLVGDLALWVAVVITVGRWGNLEVRHLADTLAAEDPLTSLVAGLIVVAALSRSAQVPLHRWLPASLTAPTPVSALLHAGVVNAGGVLLVRLNPVVGLSPVAMWLAVVAGAVTVVYATAVMVTKPDVKGGLAWSTIGQMGFMIMVCGLGLPAVAMVHLIGHALYKATLFLGSGSVVAGKVRQAAAPPGSPGRGARRLGAAVFAVGAPAAALAASSTVWPVSTSVAVFVWAAAAAVVWGVLHRRPTLRAALAATVALAAVVPAYAWAVTAAYGAWTPAAAVGGPAGSQWTVLAVVVALAGVGAARLSQRSRVGQLLYAWTVSAAHVATPPVPRRRRAAARVPNDVMPVAAWGGQP